VDVVTLEWSLAILGVTNESKVSGNVKDVISCTLRLLSILIILIM
jgi:hypothetical protein